ncbi:MAG: agmatinase [Candidatus Bathyarchaeia archaeon]
MKPIDAGSSPRFAQLATFARLPHTTELTGLDVAFVGVPFDDSTTFRAGARFGPSAIREASRLLRPYNPALDVSPFALLSVADYGDVDVVPGYIEDTFVKIQTKISSLLAARVFPLVCGGDHSISLPVLRALSKQNGRISLIHFDAHSDCWDSYFGKKYNHGTVFRRAAEEGLVDPSSSIQVGIRGSLYSAEDATNVEKLGYKVITARELYGKSLSEVAGEIHDRVKGKTHISLDIDVVDPAYAPGTGVPEAAGLTSREIIELTRSLDKVQAVGFDLVEVSPPYDSNAITSILASSLFYEFICTYALTKRGK